MPLRTLSHHPVDWEFLLILSMVFVVRWYGGLSWKFRRSFTAATPGVTYHRPKTSLEPAISSLRRGFIYLPQRVKPL